MRRLLPTLGLALAVGCGLPVNEDPEFDSPAEAGLDPDELVIGVEMEGEARAYPIEAMAPPSFKPGCESCGTTKTR